MDVNSLARELRERSVIVSAMDIFNILEKLRKNGYLYIAGTSIPKRKPVEENVQAVSQVVVTPQQPIEHKVIEADEIIKAPSIPPEALDIDIAPEIQAISIGQIVEMTSVIPTHLSKIVDGVRDAQIFERYLEINEYIKAIVLASREANIVLCSVYRDINITDSIALALLATISEHSESVAQVLNLGEFKETVVNAERYFIMLSRLKYDVVLATIFEGSIALGLMIRDFLSLKREIVELMS